MGSLAVIVVAFYALFGLGGLIGFGVWLWRRSRRPRIALIEPLDVGQVISGAFMSFGSGSLPLWLLVTATIGVPKLISGLMMRRVLGDLPPTPAMIMRATVFSPQALISLLVSVLIGLVFHIAATRYILLRRKGEVPGMVEALRQVPMLAPPVICLTLISFVAGALSALFLLWPAILLLLSWSVAMPALVMERLGPLQSISRSHALTIGSRGRILLAFLAVVVIGVVIGGILGQIDRLSGSPASVVASLLRAITSALLAMLSVGVATSLYTELLRIHGGVDSHRGLAEIFS